MAATLANGGKNPVTGKQVMKPENVPDVLAVMATAGLYDDSGKWLYATGLPAKSGVGGGIIAVVPGQVRHRRHLAAARQGGQQREGPEGDRGHLQRARRQSRTPPSRASWPPNEARRPGEGAAALAAALVVAGLLR